MTSKDLRRNHQREGREEEILDCWGTSRRLGPPEDAAKSQQGLIGWFGSSSVQGLAIPARRQKDLMEANVRRRQRCAARGRIRLQ